MLNNRRSIFYFAIVVVFALLGSASCNEDSGKFLDVVFDGTWGFTINTDTKTFTAITPYIEDHTRPFVRAINERPLEIGSQYELHMASRNNESSVTPPGELLDIRAFSQITDPVTIGQGISYASIRFPVLPTRIINSHQDSACMYHPAVPADSSMTDDACEKHPEWQKWYATSVTLRFAVKDFKDIAVTGNDYHADMTMVVPEFGNEGVLRIAVLPKHPDPDPKDPKDCPKDDSKAPSPHMHAHDAFHALMKLLSITTTDVLLPKEVISQKPGKQPGLLDASGSGLDCLPPDVFVNCTGNACNFLPSSTPPGK